MDRKLVLWCFLGVLVFTTVNALLIYLAVRLNDKNTMKCEEYKAIQVITMQSVFTGLIDGVPKYTYVPSDTTQKVCVKFKDKI